MAPLVALAAVTAALALPAAAQADTFTINGPGIGIPDNDVNTSSVTVSGLTGTVTHATATLQNVVHQNGADIDSAIVAPNGTAVFLMSDSCAGAINESLAFSDDASNFLPGAVPCDAGPYKPTNVAGDDPVPGSSTLSSFNGLDANGTWTLVIADDTMNNTGTLGGWTLTLDGLGGVIPPDTSTPPGNPTSPVNPAGNIRKRKCKKKQKTAGAQIAKKKKCKKKKHR